MITAIDPYYAAGAAAAFGFLIFAIQVFCEVQKTTHSPGSVLKRIKEFLQRIFRKIGKCIATLSSYLQWLKLETLADAAAHLLEPILGILLSWTHLFAGYFKKCFSYSTPLTVVLGTILPIAVSVTLMALYTNWLALTGQFLLNKVGMGPIQTMSGVALIACIVSAVRYHLTTVDRKLVSESSADLLGERKSPKETPDAPEEDPKTKKTQAGKKEKK